MVSIELVGQVFGELIPYAIRDLHRISAPGNVPV